MAKGKGVNRSEAEVFLSEISRHGSIGKACRVAGVSRVWFRNKKLTDEEFAEAYADACEDSIDRLEFQARAEALDGSEKLLTYLLDAHRYKKQNASDLGGVMPSITVTIGGSHASDN